MMTIAARDAAGKPSMWHVDTKNITEAKSVVTDAITEQTKSKPVAVLALVIPGAEL
jgi:hypothetical protein